MPQIRLIGLLLFITAVVLALAAAVTRTTHVRFHDPRASPGTPGAAAPIDPAPSPVGGTAAPPDARPPTLSFSSIPVAWPLLGLSGLGLMMWFMQSPNHPHASSHKRAKHTKHAKHSRGHQQRQRRSHRRR